MAKTSAIVFGIIFLIAGIWGLIANSFLGVFAADASSSVIHIVVGIILLAVASKPAAVGTLKTIGVIYIIFAILGFIQGSAILWFTTNGAATWLYLVLGIVIAVLGWSSKKGVTAPSTPAQA